MKRRRASDRHSLTVAVALSFGFALGAIPALLGAQKALTFERLTTLELPDAVERATDVRWLSDDELLLGVGGDGIRAWRIGEEETELGASLTGAHGGGFQSYSRVGGASSGGVAFAGGLFGVYLQNASGTTVLKPLEIVGDVDRRGHLTAAVGLSRRSGGYRDGDWEDHISWLFEDGEEMPRGLLPTRDEGQGMGRCWEASISAIRFVSEELVLVVPGGEPGVFVYNRSGELVESLGAESFSADGGCEIGEEESLLLGEALYSLAWLSRRRVVDEIVSDGAGNVYFFVRNMPDGVESLGTAPSVAKVRSTDDEARDEKSSTAPSAEQVADEELLEAAGTSVREALIDSGRTDDDGGRIMTRVRGFTVGHAVDAATYDPESPPPGRVCWDLLHTRVEDLTGVTRLPCAVKADLADARLRADLRGERAVVLIRGFDGLWARPAEAFEARIVPPPE